MKLRYSDTDNTSLRAMALSRTEAIMIKTMLVKENAFRKLDDPFENGSSKKYFFYVKI